MISDVYFPRINGVSTSIQTFITELRQLGHEVTLIAPAYESQQKTAFETDAGIIRIPSRQVLFDPEDRFMSRRAIRRLLSYCHQQHYDVLHIQTPFVAHNLGVWLARELGLPCVETYHTYFEEYLYHYLPLAPKRLMRYVAKRYTTKQCNELAQVIVPSSAMRDVLHRYGVRTDIQILPTGIPTQEHRPGDGARFRHVFGIAPGRPVMLTVGRVAFEKNIDFLVEVVKKVQQDIPNVLFVIAGEGPMLSHLKRRVRREGLQQQVLFVGYLERTTQLQDCYRAANVFVFASRTETQGLVLLEAMAQELPVVSTAVMGTRDVLVNQQGCLVAPDDISGFAEKVTTVLSNQSLQRQLAQTGKAYVSKWTAPRYAQKLVELYHMLIGEGPMHIAESVTESATIPGRC
jgi:glycosyltransferase involved in cell wall biosynthesis